MRDHSKKYGDDIFGFWNGTLDISIGPSPERWEEGRNLNVCIGDEELGAMSYEAYRIARGEPYVDKEHILFRRNQDRGWFARAVPEFPMFGRINYMYEDVFFDPNETLILHSECERLRAATDDQKADLGLRKLLYCCEAAMETGFGLELTCD